jgi:hypothetical protein
MHSLRELQKDFLRGVLDGDPQPIIARIRSDDIPAAQRLRIYENNCREGFLTALAAGYPVLRRLTGEQYFRQLVRSYQDEHPSPSGNLHHAGARLPQYVEHRYAGTEYDYFSHVARLEWACQEVLVAGDHAPLDVSRLAQVAGSAYPRLRFELHPAVRLVNSVYPVFTIWEAHQQEDDPEPIDLRSGGEQALVRRRDESVVIYRLSPAEFAALAALRTTRPLGRAVDDALAVDAGFDLAAALQRWATLGILVNFSVPDETGDA